MVAQHQQRPRLAYRQSRRQTQRPTHPSLNTRGVLSPRQLRWRGTAVSGPLPQFSSVITIPPVLNRLVLFSPGLLHRINPFDGERYPLAANAWTHQSGVNVIG